MHPGLIEIDIGELLKVREIDSVTILKKTDPIHGTYNIIDSYVASPWVAWNTVTLAFAVVMQEAGYGYVIGDPTKYVTYIASRTFQFDYSDVWDYIETHHPGWRPYTMTDMEGFSGAYSFGDEEQVVAQVDTVYIGDEVIGADLTYDVNMGDSFDDELSSLISFSASEGGGSYERGMIVGNSRPFGYSLFPLASLSGVYWNCIGRWSYLPKIPNYMYVYDDTKFYGYKKLAPEQVTPPPPTPDITPDIDPDLTGVKKPGRKTTGVSQYSTGVFQTEWSDIAEFDSVYIPAEIDLNLQSSMVVGYGHKIDEPGQPLEPVVSGQGDIMYQGIYIESIKQSLIDSDEMTFVQPTKYDGPAVFPIKSKVIGLVFGQPKFIGYIKSIARVLTSDGQYIRYTAKGLRSWLYELPFATEFHFRDIGIQDAFKKVVDAIPSGIVAHSDISKLPTTKIPELDLSPSTYGRALDAILDLAGHYAYYIDHTYKLTVYDLKSLSAKDIHVAVEGQKLSDHSEYIVERKNLNLDITQCKTRCIIQGDFPLQEVEATISPGQIVVTGKSTTPYQIIYHMHVYFQLHPNLFRSLLSDPSKEIICSSSKTGYLQKLLYVNLPRGIVVISISAPQPRAGSYYFRYAYRASEPLKYDTGWTGSAYTQHKVQQVITINDSRFKKQSGPNVYQIDDTDKMREYANLLLEGKKEVKWGGTVDLDGLQNDFNIGDCVNFKNTTENWTNVKLAILSITYNFNQIATSLELTNAYFLGTGILDLKLKDREIKREAFRDRDYKKKLIKDIEAKI